MWEAELYRIKGRALSMQRFSKAEIESYYLKAIQIAPQQEAKSLELRAAISLFTLWQDTENENQARETL